jgi:hypothetical protein
MFMGGNVNESGRPLCGIDRAPAFHCAPDAFRRQDNRSVTSHATAKTSISCNRATAEVVSTHDIGIRKLKRTPSPNARNQIMYVKRGLIATPLAAALLCGRAASALTTSNSESFMPTGEYRSLSFTNVVQWTQ